MSGTITSGKALKAVYWPLIVRCKEKMKMWKPNLRTMIDIIIEGAMAYPNTIAKYVEDTIVPVNYEIDITQNVPLQEDEVEKKNMDLAEVTTNVMSKKSYMKKWRDLTDKEVDEELEQIALERQIIEDAAFPMDDSGLPYPDNSQQTTVTEEDSSGEGEVTEDNLDDEAVVDDEGKEQVEEQ